MQAQKSQKNCRTSIQTHYIPTVLFYVLQNNDFFPPIIQIK